MDNCKTYQLAKHVGNDVDTDAAYAMLADVILRSAQHDEDETEFNDYLLHHYPMDKERLKNCVARSNPVDSALAIEDSMSASSAFHVSALLITPTPNF